MRVMRRAARGIGALAAAMVVLAACAGVEQSGPPIITDPLRTTTTETMTTTSRATSTTSVPTTSTIPLPEGPTHAVVTTTGVVTAVRAVTTSGFVVITPCGSPVFLDEEAVTEEIHQVQVVLDPGHGGPIDTGAVGPNGLQEKEINLRVAELTAAILRSRGITTLLTRTADYATPLSVRSELADTVQAGLMVSIHHNAPTPGVSFEPGTEIFVQSDTPESSRLGGLVYQQVVTGLASAPGVEWHAAPDAGVLEVHNPEGFDTYGMIRLPETVSILAEIAYISAESEAEFLASSAYLDLVTPALADAIEDYLTTDAEGDGHIAEPRVFTAQPSVGAEVCAEVPLS
jgi:N-acetylmuramoyl-L-alanine amidase